MRFTPQSNSTQEATAGTALLDFGASLCTTDIDTNSGGFEHSNPAEPENRRNPAKFQRNIKTHTTYEPQTQPFYPLTQSLAWFEAEEAPNSSTHTEQIENDIDTQNPWDRCYEPILTKQKSFSSRD